ncbi:hypothetical protein OIV83_005300 [Microbotryomycetes sp. JL201]|nr:hypothetical protein OIV83_005300 [Microbotryomycetes sp. JL201]
MDGFAEIKAAFATRRTDTLGPLAWAFVVRPIELGVWPWQHFEMGSDPFVSLYLHDHSSSHPPQTAVPVTSHSAASFLPQLDSAAPNDETKRWACKTVWAVLLLLKSWLPSGRRTVSDARQVLALSFHTAFSQHRSTSDVAFTRLFASLQEYSYSQWDQLSSFHKIMVCGLAFGLEDPRLFDGILAGHPRPDEANDRFARLPKALNLHDALSHVQFLNFVPLPVRIFIFARQDTIIVAGLWRTLLALLESFVTIVERDQPNSPLAIEGSQGLRDIRRTDDMYQKTSLLHAMVSVGHQVGRHERGKTAWAEKVLRLFWDSFRSKIETACLAQRRVWPTTNMALWADVELAADMWQAGESGFRHGDLPHMYSIVRAQEYLDGQEGHAAAASLVGLATSVGAGSNLSGQAPAHHHHHEMNALAGTRGDEERHLITTKDGVPLTLRQYRRAFGGVGRA